MNIIIPEGIAPVYLRYPTQYKPQDAFIQIDLRTDEVLADYNPEISNAVPATVWEGKVRRIPIPAQISGKALREIMESQVFATRVERLIHEAIIGMDGTVTNEGLLQDIECSIQNLFEGLDFDSFAPVWDSDGLYDWLRLLADSDLTPEQCAEQVEQEAIKEEALVQCDVIAAIETLRG